MGRSYPSFHAHGCREALPAQLEVFKERFSPKGENRERGRKCTKQGWLSSLQLFQTWKIKLRKSIWEENSFLCLL